MGIDDKRRTPLQAAANIGNINIVDYLLQKGADLSHKDKDEGNAALDALLAGHEKILEFLLESGVDRDSPDKDGNCLLHMAIQAGHTELYGCCCAYI